MQHTKGESMHINSMMQHHSAGDGLGMHNRTMQARSRRGVVPTLEHAIVIEDRGTSQCAILHEGCISPDWSRDYEGNIGKMLESSQ